MAVRRMRRQIRTSVAASGGKVGASSSMTGNPATGTGCGAGPVAGFLVRASAVSASVRPADQNVVHLGCRGTFGLPDGQMRCHGVRHPESGPAVTWTGSSRRPGSDRCTGTSTRGSISVRFCDAVICTGWKGFRCKSDLRYGETICIGIRPYMWRYHLSVSIPRRKRVSRNRRGDPTGSRRAGSP